MVELRISFSNEELPVSAQDVVYSLQKCGMLEHKVKGFGNVCK